MSSIKKIMKKNIKHFGFTLIELLVTITIIGIITVIAVPNYLKYYQRIHLKNAVSELKSALNEGFSYARSHSKHVVLTTVKEGETFFLEFCEKSDCVDKVFLPGFNDILFKGKSKIISDDLDIKFLAPYGNIENLDLTGAGDIVEIKIDNPIGEQRLRIYKKSGLVETLPFTSK